MNPLQVIRFVEKKTNMLLLTLGTQKEGAANNVGKFEVKEGIARMECVQKQDLSPKTGDQ